MKQNRGEISPAAIRTAKRASRVAHEPDLLISVAESAPLPKGPATGAPATDLLYESIQECLASAEERKHEDRIGHERVKHGIQTRAELLKHHMQECVPEPALEPALEPAPACLLITPDDPPRSGGWHSGQSGKHSKDKAGGASVKWADAGWSDNDMLIESDDRPRRVTVVAPIQQLRQPKMNRSGALPALRPKSRAECERRCGSDGFCDPSDPLGCGGLHCGQQHNMLD